MVRLRNGSVVFCGLLLALSLVLVGGGIGLAQEATPAVGGGHGHPAHIHKGTCDNLDPAPAFPLTDVGTATPAGTPTAGGGTMGPQSAIPVATSVTTVDAALADIVQGGHAINIHASAEEIGTYIACGDIGGTVTGDQLVIGLQELNNSGHSGVAVLRGLDSQTEVTIYLAEGLSGGTDEGTPAAGTTAEAGEMVVDIEDFAYHPDPIEVSVGSAVTWTNLDSEPHTATARDRDMLQSGTLKQGDTYTETFEAAGTYEYFCEFHANMKGTIIIR